MQGREAVALSAVGVGTLEHQRQASATTTSRRLGAEPSNTQKGEERSESEEGAWQQDEECKPTQATHRHFGYGLGMDRFWLVSVYACLTVNALPSGVCVHHA